MSLNTTPDSYTTLLIHSDTSDGSTTFVDSSANGHTITAVGTAHHEADQAKFGATGIFFDGNSDALTLADHADWDFGTGDFTVDCWYYGNSASGYPFIIGSGGDSDGWSFQHYNNNSIRFRFGEGSPGDIEVVSTGDMTFGVWHHLAAVVSSGTYYTFFDGKLKNTGTVSAATNASSQVSGILWIGRNTITTSYYLNGYVDEVRISKGIARWTENFTPPTRPYSIIDDQFHTDIDTISDREIVVGGVDSYTKLLIHSDDIDEGTTFIDSSPSGSHTITSTNVSHSIDNK